MMSPGDFVGGIGEVDGDGSAAHSPSTGADAMLGDDPLLY